MTPGPGGKVDANECAKSATLPSKSAKLALLELRLEILAFLHQKVPKSANSTRYAPRRCWSSAFRRCHEDRLKPELQ